MRNAKTALSVMFVITKGVYEKAYKMFFVVLPHFGGDTHNTKITRRSNKNEGVGHKAFTSCAVFFLYKTI